MYSIKQVTIDGLHNTNNKIYKLSKDTYIYGMNGSGKSTILQGIQFALLGYIPGSAKTKSSILSHSNKNSINVQLVLISDSNEEIKISRSITKIGNKINDTLITNPDNVDIRKLMNGLDIPVFDFSEFISLSANKQKDSLSSLLPITSNIIVSTYCKKLNSYDPSLAYLLKDNTQKSVRSPQDAKYVVEYFKQIQTAIVAEQKRLVSTTQSLIFYDDYTDNEDPQSILNKINELRNKQSHITKLESQISQNNILKNKIEALRNPAGNELANSLSEDSDYKKLDEQLSELSNFDHDAECSKLKEIQQRANEIRANITQYKSIIESGTNCPILNIQCKDLSDNIETLRSKLPEMIDQYDKLHSEYCDKEKYIRNMSSRLDKCVEDVRKYHDIYKKRDDFESLIVHVDEYNSIDKRELEFQISELQNKYAKASANEKYQQMMGELQKQKLQIESSLTFVKDIIKAFGENGIQSELIKQPFENLANQMQLTMVNDWHDSSLGMPHFVIESRANSFDFGFIRNNKFLSFSTLSSGEKCCFMTLFLTTLVKNSKSELKVVLIDDLFDHLDSKKFENLLSSNTDVQLIVAGVKDPEFSTNSFTVINL